MLQLYFQWKVYNLQGAVHSRCGANILCKYYITLHYITLHYITLHYITLHYVTLRYITLHYITLHYVTLHYITLHYMLYCEHIYNQLCIHKWIFCTWYIYIPFQHVQFERQSLVYSICFWKCQLWVTTNKMLARYRPT
jgi:hypothetical protein